MLKSYSHEITSQINTKIIPTMKYAKHSCHWPFCVVQSKLNDRLKAATQPVWEKAEMKKMNVFKNT